MQYNFHATPYSSDRVIQGLSITAAGRIGLPKHFLTTYRVLRPVRANLYWDTEARLLAIKFTDESDPRAYPVSFTQRYGAFINAARFFRQQKIELGNYLGRYSYTVTTGSDIGISTDATVFLISLRTGSPPGNGHLKP